MEGSTLYKGRLQEIGENDLDKCRVNDSGHNEGTSKRVNGCQGDGFFEWGTRTDTIKLVMAGTQD